MAPSKKKNRSTQEFVPIQEVRDGVVILKDGSYRAVVLCSSMNFALKSENEQQAIITQFQNFLNTLDFSLQIFLESRRLDIRPYLALLEGRYQEQVNDLMKIQTREYIDFIKNFTESTNIMTKTFFIVVPYSPTVAQTGGNAVTRLIPHGRSIPEENVKNKLEQFEESRLQLEERLSVVEQGLIRCGLRTVPLGTEEVIELFYKILNPGEMEKPISLQS